MNGERAVNCLLRLRPHDKSGPREKGVVHWWTTCCRCGRRVICATEWGGPT